MAVCKITIPGLTAMAVAVTLLWGCLIGERLILRQAASQQAAALRRVQLLRSPQPVRLPVPHLRMRRNKLG